MSVSIVYRSRMGASYYYAQALRENLDGELYFYKSLPQEKANMLIYCAGLNKGKIDGWKELSPRLSARGDQVIIALSCITHVTEELKKEIAEKNCVDENVLFLMKGKLDYNKANLLEKWAIKSMRNKILVKKVRTREEGELLNALTYPTDLTDIRCILPIVKKVRG